MQRLSSNLTLFFKLFIPVFFTVFYGAFTLTLLLTDIEDLGFLPYAWFPVSNLVFYLACLLIMFVTVWKLKRVDADETYIYISNYFKTYRYAYSSIAKMDETSFLLFKIIIIRFREKTSFGKQIFFLKESRLFNTFVEENPDQFAGLWPSSRTEHSDGA